MPADLSEEPAAPQHEAISRIRAAFAGVTREGGMSWSESWASDGGPASDCPLFPDPDRHWSKPADNPRWDPHLAWGGFSLLDPIGARHDLAAALAARCRR